MGEASQQQAEVRTAALRVFSSMALLAHMDVGERGAAQCWGGCKPGEVTSAA